MNEAISKCLERSSQVLEDGDFLLSKRGSIISAVSRYYYAMFYAAEAALLSVNQEVHSHKGMIAQLGKNLIKTGYLEPSLG